MKFKEPSHYTKNGISPLECFKKGLISNEEFKGFCKGNIIKYICRSKDNELDDYYKALDYCYQLIIVGESENVEKEQ